MTYANTCKHVHRENESQGTEVPLVQVYFVRSLYTAHIWDMWSDKLCNIDSLFQS